MVEAAYSNTLIISSNCQNGPNEILENGKNGFLFENNKENSFLQKFKELNETSEKNINLMKLNAKKMSKKYSLYNHYKSLIKIIDYN